MESSSRKQGFKKCRSATFSIDGFSFTIVANETGGANARPAARFARSKSQNALWNAITAGIGIKDKDKRGIVIDPRPGGDPGRRASRRGRARRHGEDRHQVRE
ncbi:hypothetical protein ANANG_G00077140 [Anguilla anguilla]|uniref:Uncharacterized protein n=1 Tax=Anguilla anguilla TaxID=7936 RepID=A0A9D3MJN8_ANGAN|nr:hypothetical protein ANANG_G00077140 [Anguilla anguilla]